MTCPDENVLGELARGELSPSEQAEVEAHLDQCAVCSEVVAELTKIFASSFSGPNEREREPEPGLDSREDDERPEGDSLDATLDDAATRSPERDWPDLPLPEGSRLGRYVVLRAVGAGAMGIVYAAYDPELDRKVALKLLRRVPGSSFDGDTQSDRNRRLLREAQALARLSHPGVITVHDVGTFEQQVFLAMEFVEGGTLTTWLHAEPRSWRTVLQVFRQAGEGLVAAHEAGLVHRDFKPDNVLMHADGRAVVTDFGLARPLSRASEYEQERTLEVSVVSASVRAARSASALAHTLTRTGALVGTPAYMAPEQLDGKRSDAKADQFGFCVALYEGLYGKRPFLASDLPGLIHAVFSGQIAPPPRDRKVPRWLRRAVLQGLRVEPSERHADMRALLHALRPPTLQSWRGVVAMAGLSVVAGAGAVALSSRTTPEPVSYCDDVAAKLDGVWDDQARQALATSFAATGLPFGADVGERVITELDAYAAAWVEAQTDACRASEQGREAEAVVAERMTCLARRRITLSAMVSALEQADADTVMQAVDAVQLLPSLQPCRDAAALGRSLPPVPEGERAEVEAVRMAIDESEALRTLGKVSDDMAKAREAMERAEPLRYGPVRAEATVGLGVALHQSGEIETAEATLHRALSLSVASHHDEMIARVAAELAHLEIGRMGPPKVSERWVALGLAGLEALGGSRPDLRANLLGSLANVQRHSGDLAGSIETGRQVLAIREENWGVDHYSVVEPLTELGLAHARAGDYEESVRLIERARTILLRVYGEQHPHYAMVLQNLATTHFVHGQYAEALRIYEESHRLIRDGLGAKHPATAVLAYNVATALAFLERYDEALGFEAQAQAIEDEVHGKESLSAATGWALVGEIHLRAGRFEPAVEAIRKALTISTTVAPGERGRHANFRSQLGWALVGAGRVDEARRELEQALAVQRETAGEPSVEIAETIGRLAMVELAQGRLDEARAKIDVSVTQYESEDPDPHQHAEARFRRAQVMLAQGQRAEAKAEAERGLAIYERFGDQPSRIAGVKAWLAGLSEPSP